MGKTINTKIDDGIITFTFTNNQDEVFAFFKMNPSDIHLAKRCEEVSSFFAKEETEIENITTLDDAYKYDNKIKEQFNYLLGYGAEGTLFSGMMTPTTILPNGSIWAFVILDTIVKAIEPELEKRRKNAEKNISKYVEKYKK